MKNYLFVYLWFVSVLGVIPILCILFLYQTGEYERLDATIVRQISQPEKIIYGSALHSNTYSYKKRLLSNSKPKIIALGSSRVMQFRQYMFSKSFVNTGGVMNSISDGINFTKNNQEIRSKVVLLGVDIWWFNQNYQNPGAQSEISDINNFYPQIDDIVSTLNWVIEGKISLHEILKVLATGSKNIGLRGYFKDGFGVDGSHYYTRLITGKVDVPDLKFRDTISRIEKGINAFQHASEADKLHVENFISLIRGLESSGSHVVIFFPPFAKAVNNIMSEMTQSYGYVDDIKVKLHEEGLNFYDYTDASSIGSGDCEFIDGFHGGEVSYARILLDLAKRNSHIKNNVDIEALASSIGKYEGNAFVRDENITKLKEVDFLGIGCDKR